MDQDHIDFDFDVDLDLDLGDNGVPPAIELEPRPEPNPRSLPVDGDPEVPWLTPVMILAVLCFGGLSLAILSSGGGGGGGGAALAWVLGGAFAFAYVGAILLGTRYFYDNRYR